jgi:signal transduction histidine kinase
LALTFAIFGTLISLLLALGISFSARGLNDHLLVETLHAEIEGYISRRERNPNALLPSTVNLQGYLSSKQAPNQNIPRELLVLTQGTHRLVLNQQHYRVSVLDKNGERYFMMFNEESQHKLEQMFTLYLVSVTLIMITNLAKRVGAANPGEDVEVVTQGFAADEIGQLAQVFSVYLKRMRDFIDRERNFTSDVSHELRTPLTIVQGVLELMEDDLQTPVKQRERIAKIERANREMINLTTALLLMAREKSNDADVQFCAVNDVVNVVVDMNRHLLSSNTKVEIINLTDSMIPAERMLLSIVVSNLIRNAFIHTAVGTVIISIEHNQLIVTDTGSGIPSKDIGKVFQKYFRGSGSAGSGIGLSLVKRICDRYEWEINLTSIEGQGTSAKLIFAPA